MAWLLLLDHDRQVLSLINLEVEAETPNNQRGSEQCLAETSRFNSAGHVIPGWCQNYHYESNQHGSEAGTDASQESESHMLTCGPH